MEFEIENCIRNIDFYKEQIRRMEQKIVNLKRNKEDCEACSKEELLDKLKHYLNSF